MAIILEYFVIVLTCLIQVHSCERICFSCTDLKENETCHNVETCQNNEVCFVQKYRTLHNETRYDVGCTNPELCRKDLTGNLVRKRRSDHSHVVCQKCCSDANICNNDMTCDAVLQVPRQKCLTCSVIESPDMCKTNTVCEKDEICFIHKYATGSGQHHYDLGCKHSTLCLHGSISNVFGRRSSSDRHLVCESCCSGNEICNMNLNCSHENQRTVNASCSTTNECASNLVCLSARCQCILNEYYWANYACIKKKAVNNVCAQSNQCQHTLQCVNHLCSCPHGKYWNGVICTTTKSFNVACTSSVECGDSMFCTLGRCKCDITNYWTGNTCATRKPFNSTCLTTNECERSFLRCIQGKCDCPSSEYWNGKICAVRKPFNSTCLTTIECERSFLRCIQGKCDCPSSEYWNGKICAVMPRECMDIAADTDGVYTIYPTNSENGVNVYCIMRGIKKWTVIQRRVNGSLSFDRVWHDYKYGFGSAAGEYWLGNKNIHQISANGHHEISIYLEESLSKFGYANYSTFHVGDEGTKYVLNITGYFGNTSDDMDKPGNSKFGSNGMQFSTIDQDNDLYDSGSCAVSPQVRGGWWYNKCYYANINKIYDLYWDHFSTKIKKSIMMIRRT